MKLSDRFYEFGKSIYLGIARQVDYTRSSKGGLGAEVFENHKGSVPATGRGTVVLFAHFDGDGAIADYVIEYLRVLRSSLGAEIHFVSTSPYLVSTDVARAAQHCVSIARRGNRTLDFGSWKIALRHAGDIQGYDRLILANDSVFGPFQPLEPILKSLPTDRPAILGITDTWERRYHLQSYFLAFNRPAMETEYFKNFWNEFLFLGSKRHIINDYEIGVSQKALRAGVELVTYCSGNRARDLFMKSMKGVPLPKKYYRRALNPTHCYWRELISDLGCPFVKAELLKFNPAKIENLGEFIPVLAAASSYPPDLIVRHLKRVATNCCI